MYGATIPEDDAAEAILSKQPRKNQLRVVVASLVALCVGVLIGALGTAMMLPPTPAPRLSLEDSCPRVHSQIVDDDNVTDLQEKLVCCNWQLEICAARACCVCD